MHIIFAVLGFLLSLYFYALLARFGFDLILSLNRQFRPRGLLLVLAEIVMTITDPTLKLLRKVLPPIRIGGLGLDFSITIAMILVSILSGLVSSLG
jgi:YggT family protein